MWLHPSYLSVGILHLGQGLTLFARAKALKSASPTLAHRTHPWYTAPHLMQTSYPHAQTALFLSLLGLLTKFKHPLRGHQRRLGSRSTLIFILKRTYFLKISSEPNCLTSFSSNSTAHPCCIQGILTTYPFTMFVSKCSDRHTLQNLCAHESPKNWLSGLSS